MDEKDVVARLLLVEERLSRQADREWVKDFVRPIQESVSKIETGITALTGELQEITQAQKQLYEAHNAFLKQQADDQLQQARERTPWGIAKKYGPLVIFITALITLFRIGGTYAEVYIRQVMAQHDAQQTSSPNR